MVFPTPEYNSAVKSMKVITHTLDSTVTSPMPRQTHLLISLTPTYRRARAHKDRLIRERLEDAKSRMLRLGDKAGEFTDVTSATDHMVRREAQAAAKENRAPQYESPSASKYNPSHYTDLQSLCLDDCKMHHFSVHRG